MRVCASASGSLYDTSTDPEGNRCNWHKCGLENFDANYFGGCNGNWNAGALCCLP